MENYICINGKKTGLDSDLSMETAKNKLKGFVGVIADSKEEKLLRHGDYGYLFDGVPRLISFDKGFLKTTIDVNDTYPLTTNQPSDYTILGNIFDDLKRNAEDLEEFENHTIGGGIFEMRIGIGSQLIVFYKDGHATATLNEAIEIHQKLGQLIATAKRRKAKDC